MNTENKKSVGLHALYEDDPVSADLKVFGRVAN
mgnify:CR=1 FL=1